MADADSTWPTRRLHHAPTAASEVLLVWNGNDPPAPSLFKTRAPVRVRAEPKVGSCCALQTIGRGAEAWRGGGREMWPRVAGSSCRTACPPLIHQVHLPKHWPLLLRRPPQNDLSNRVRPDSGIRTGALLLADDDLLLP